MQWRQFAQQQPTISTGLMYGAMLGPVLLVLAVIENVIGIGQGLPQTIALWTTIIITGLTYIRAGWVASSLTDRMSSGTVAGMITGCVAYTINLLGHLLVLPFYISQLHTNSHLSSGSIIGSVLTTLIYWIAFFGLLGGVLGGCIGGNIGIHRAPRPILAPRATNAKSD